MTMEKLEKIAEGYYTNETTKAIAVKPQDLTYGRYFLNNALGKAEHEDLGARLIEAAQKQGTWVGMDYSTLKGQLIKEAHEENPSKQIFSVLSTLALEGAKGALMLGNELLDMSKQGYLQLVTIDNKTVIIPTQKLAETVYNAQGHKKE